MSTAMRSGRMAMALGKSVCWRKTMAAVHQQIASRLSTMRRSSSSMALAPRVVARTRRGAVSRGGPELKRKGRHETGLKSGALGCRRWGCCSGALGCRDRAPLILILARAATAAAAAAATAAANHTYVSTSSAAANGTAAATAAAHAHAYASTNAAAASATATSATAASATAASVTAASVAARKKLAQQPLLHRRLVLARRLRRPPACRRKLLPRPAPS
eukprot:scaffold7629_cov60-Phaeocystis_antarctica.AAC.2